MQAASREVSKLNSNGVLLYVAYDSKAGSVQANYNYVKSNYTNGAGNFYTDNIDWITSGPTTVVVDLKTMRVLEKANFTNASQAISICKNKEDYLY